MLHLSNYKGKKILILGLGLNEGGVGSAKFFAKNGADVLVTDVKTQIELAPSIKKLKGFPNITFHLGGHKNEDIDWADLIIRNQAIKPNNFYLQYAISKDKEIKTDVEIFLESVNPENIIGVTGTKGKSTTSSLIYQVVKEADKKTVLAGNIGKSVLDSIDYIDKDTLVVLEISSFQLESFDANKISPKYAVITNIYPDHLNYYPSMDEYIESKKLIARHQTQNDFLFINREDKTLTSENFLKGITSKVVFYSPSILPKDFKPQMPGEHNLSNYAGAFVVSRALNIPEDIALKALEDFKGVEFRLQLIKQWNGIKIYNNTTATAPEPAIESLKALGSPENEEPNIILIAGGMNKGLNYKSFAEAIGWYAKTLYLLEGDIEDQLLCDSAVVAIHEGTFNNLEDLLKKLKKDIEEREEYFKPGDIILFSPGATSFNLFQNEFDRGRKFNEAVEKVFN